MKVMIASGGTGGHLYPAIAVGETYRKAGHEVVFVGSGRPLDLKVASESHFRWLQLRVKRLKGMGILSKLFGLFSIPWALLKAIWILILEKPDLSIGFGGSSTGPIILMSRILGLHTAIVEQNAIPGFTNRLLALFAQKIFISFPNTRFARIFQRKCILTGNPIRSSVLDDFQKTSDQPVKTVIFVFGGSQGAHFLNQLMIDVLPMIESKHSQLKIIHLTGNSETEIVKASYKKYPELEFDVRPYSDEMGVHYREADLVISRSGAATITELSCLGRASILIPYPFAADDHQFANAEYLSSQGAAWTYRQNEFNADLLKDKILEFLQNPEKLDESAQKAKSLAFPEAANEIVLKTEHLLGKVRSAKGSLDV